MLTGSIPAARLRGVEAVVIGASAGGVDALGVLLPELPAETPFPVVVVLHLRSDQPSGLVDLFGPRCAVAVREAGDKEPASAGAWFAPPDYHLLVEAGGTFALSIEPPVNHSRPAIDPLFESAAAAWGRALLGIVLTGASADGAAGAAAVRAAGGLVVVQDPATAEFGMMPRAALRAASPHAALPLGAIAALLRSSALERRP